MVELIRLGTKAVLITATLRRAESILKLDQEHTKKKVVLIRQF